MKASDRKYGPGLDAYKLSLGTVAVEGMDGSALLP